MFTHDVENLNCKDKRRNLLLISMIFSWRKKDTAEEKNEQMTNYL